jgi:hypothetical protein
LVEQHLEERLRSWPGRFARQHGPLRPVVERVPREFLKCGRWRRTAGIVVSIATAGDLLQWHPHLHLIATDGGQAPTARGTRQGSGTPSG